MPQNSPSSPAARGTWWAEISKPARVGFACAILIAFGLVAAEGVFDGSLGPERPRNVARLGLKLGCFFACGVSFTIAGIGTFRAWRRATRVREGLCPECGYDLHATPARCPECGASSPSVAE